VRAEAQSSNGRTVGDKRRELGSTWRQGSFAKTYSAFFKLELGLGLSVAEADQA
jgi:hypothetical protein